MDGSWSQFRPCSSGQYHEHELVDFVLGQVLEINELHDVYAILDQHILMNGMGLVLSGESHSKAA